MTDAERRVEEIREQVAIDKRYPLIRTRTRLEDREFLLAHIDALNERLRVVSRNSKAGFVAENRMSLKLCPVCNGTGQKPECPSVAEGGDGWVT